MSSAVHIRKHMMQAVNVTVNKTGSVTEIVVATRDFNENVNRNVAMNMNRNVNLNESMKMGGSIQKIVIETLKAFVRINEYMMVEVIVDVVESRSKCMTESNCNGRTVYSSVNENLV
jgi:hypothetical protein